MKILSASITNFGSYKHLEFDFSSTGLALLYGPTGSGKSTLQDIVPWILFGNTSKNGNVDEIRNWKSDSPTIGVLTLLMNDNPISITRVRGNPQQNDLYWTIGEEKHRGKDLIDTQKILNSLLSIDYDSYILAATYNEFSEAGMFFLSKAKDKREVFEKVVDLSFPARVLESTVLSKKETKKLIDVTQKQITKFASQLEALATNDTYTRKQSNKWEADKLNIVASLIMKSNQFEKQKQADIDTAKDSAYKFDSEVKRTIDTLIDKLDELDQKILPKEEFEKKEAKLVARLQTACSTCGKTSQTSPELEALREAKRSNNKYMEKFAEYGQQLREVQKSKNPYTNQVRQCEQALNQYGEQLEAKQAEQNPYLEQLTLNLVNREYYYIQLSKTKDALTDLETKLSALDQIYDLSFDLRGELLKNVVNKIQNHTNNILQTHFESEFKVVFTLSGADSLDVDISKNGHPCVYKQLSKGQRSLLKLCFAISIMDAAANKLGQHFNLLTFDEALDGMDVDLKLKAFSLFESLNAKHPSVLVVEHTPEFQNLFSEKYRVSINADESNIERE